MIGRPLRPVTLALLLAAAGCNDEAVPTPHAGNAQRAGTASTGSGARAPVASASSQAPSGPQPASARGFGRIIAQPVTDFVLQGRQVWVRTELLAAPGGGRAGRVHHHDGKGWNSYPLRNSRSGHLGERFLIGPGASVRLVGLDVDCCAMAKVVGVRWLGGRWGPLASDQHGLPKDSEIAPQFELATVAGDPPVLCHDSLLPMPCYSLRGGRWAVIRDADGYQSMDFVAISRRAGRTIAWLKDAFYSLTVENEWERLEDVPTRTIGYDGKPWLHIGSHGELWCGCCGTKHECAVQAWNPKSKKWRTEKTGLGRSAAMLQRAPDDAWIVGADGIAHSDGKTWRRVAALPGSYAQVKEGLDGVIWVGGDEGLWRVRSARPPQEHRVDLASAKLTQKGELPLGPAPGATLPATTGSLEISRRKLPGVKGAWLEGPDTVWFYDDEALWRRYRGRVQRVDRLRISDTLRCRRCGTGDANGSWEIWSGAIRFHARGPRSPKARRRRLRRPMAPGVVYRPHAIRATREGSVWVVGESHGSAATSVARYVQQRWQRVILPGTHVFHDVFPVSESEAWIAGGKASAPDSKADPVGLLIHVTAGGSQQVRVPGAWLHGVATLPDGTAIAVGDAGTVVVWKRSQVARWHLHSQPGLLRVEQVGEALLAVGERGTLVRFDGTTWTSLALPGVGYRTLSDVLPTTAATWIMGPTYLARTKRLVSP